MENLRLVILESPYHTLYNNQQAKDLFIDIISMRMEGFKQFFGDGVLAASDVDYVATHVAICEEVEGRFRPITAFKFINLKDCEKFDIEFPLYKWLKDERNNELYLPRFNRYIDDQTKSFSYVGSLTSCPSYARKLRLRKRAKDMILESYASVMREHGADENFLLSIQTSFKFVSEIGFKKFYPDLFVVKDVRDNSGHIMNYVMRDHAQNELSQFYKDALVIRRPVARELSISA